MILMIIILITIITMIIVVIVIISSRQTGRERASARLSPSQVFVLRFESVGPLSLGLSILRLLDSNFLANPLWT